MNFEADPRSVCIAFQQVTGICFDSASERDLQLVAGLVPHLSPETFSRIVESLSESAIDDQGSIEVKDLTSFRFERLPQKEWDADDLLNTNYPSDAGAAFVEDVETENLRTSSHTQYELDDHNILMVLPSVQKSLTIYSPNKLGFPDREESVAWSRGEAAGWVRFICKAEEQLKKTKTSLQIWETVQDDLSIHQPKKVYLAERLAKNYCVVNLNNRAVHSKAHFLFGRHMLYVVIIENGEERLKKIAKPEEVEAFVDAIVEAYDGHQDLVKATFMSLRKTFRLSR